MRPSSVLRLALIVAAMTAGINASAAAPTTPAGAADLTAVKVPRLESLDPQRYLQNRHRRPIVGPELQALPLEVSLAILAGAEIPVADDDAYPAGLKDDAREAQHAKERRAALSGALDVVSRSGDARAFDAVVGVIKRTSGVDDALAGFAAERLGDVGAATPSAGVVQALQGLAVDVEQPHPVRTGALAGLARLRTRDALDVILAVTATTEAKSGLRRSALLAIEHLCSKWAFEARGAVADGEALRARAMAGLRPLVDDDAVAAVITRLQ